MPAKCDQAMKILEIKRHINKPDQSYLCDLLKRGKDYIIIKYVNEQPGSVGSVFFDTGSTTYAYYRDGTGYVLWKMMNPQGVLEGYLFHICCDLRVRKDRVAYLDLLLDIWVDPRGRLEILDRDEVQECARAGMLGAHELEWIAQQEQQVVESWRHMVDDFDRLLQHFERRSPST